MGDCDNGSIDFLVFFDEVFWYVLVRECEEWEGGLERVDIVGWIMKKYNR